MLPGGLLGHLGASGGLLGGDSQAAVDLCFRCSPRGCRGFLALFWGGFWHRFLLLSRRVAFRLQMLSSGLSWLSGLCLETQAFDLKPAVVTQTVSYPHVGKVDATVESRCHPNLVCDVVNFVGFCFQLEAKMLKFRVRVASKQHWHRLSLTGIDFPRGSYLSKWCVRFRSFWGRWHRLSLTSIDFPNKGVRI